MDDQEPVEHDEEMMCEPEDLKVGPPDELHWRGDHKKESARDDEAGPAACEGENGTDCPVVYLQRIEEKNEYE